LIEADAGIALGIGGPLLQPTRARRHRSSSNSRSGESSRTHSRTPSQTSAPPLSTLAGAMYAANIAGASVSVTGSRQLSPDKVQERVKDLVETSACGKNEAPQPPVLVSPSELFEDGPSDSLAGPSTESATPTDYSESPLPTRVEGVTATSMDIPTPPIASRNSPAATPTPGADTTTAVSQAPHTQELSDSDDDASTASEGLGAGPDLHPGAQWHTLASTPSLMSAQPLIPDNIDPFDAKIGSSLPSAS